MSELDTLAINIKKIRKILSMSQFDFACSCDISVRILSSIENAKENVTINTISKIACFLGVNIIDLLSDKLNVNTIKIIA